MIKKNIEYLIRTQQVRQKDLAEVLGLTTMTIQKRLSQPGNWQEKEIKKLAEYFELPPGVIAWGDVRDYLIRKNERYEIEVISENSSGVNFSVRDLSHFGGDVYYITLKSSSTVVELLRYIREYFKE